MLGSASPICWKTVSPLEASAPKAAANLLGRALVTDFMATDCIFVLGVVVCFVQWRRCALFFHLSYEDADIRNTQ